MSSNDRRTVLKVLTGAVAGIGVTLASLPFIRSMGLSDRAKANRFTFVDINIEKLKEGEVISIKDTLRPILILKRSKETLVSLASNTPDLADPESLESVQPESTKNVYRSLRPDLLVVENICTHLGCAVAFSPENSKAGYLPAGGFFCPCHGSAYDQSGRVFKNMPAQKNLAIPSYELIDENTVRVKIDNRL